MCTKNKPALWQVFSPCQISKNIQETQFLRNFTVVHILKITYETKTRANAMSRAFWAREPNYFARTIQEVFESFKYLFWLQSYRIFSWTFDSESKFTEIFLAQNARVSNWFKLSLLEWLFLRLLLIDLKGCVPQPVRHFPCQCQTVRDVSGLFFVLMLIWFAQRESCPENTKKLFNDLKSVFKAILIFRPGNWAQEDRRQGTICKRAFRRLKQPSPTASG